MTNLTERWFEFSRPLRWIIWVLVSLLMLALGSYTNRPVQPRPHQMGAQWQRLILLRSQRSTVTAEKFIPFSAIAFQRDGSQLISWLPTLRGGELILDSDWHTIPTLFDQLALQGMKIIEFSVEPQATFLRITLQLEATDHA